MQETDSIHAQSENTETPRAGFFRRYRFLWLALLVLLLLAIVKFQHQFAPTAI